MPSAMLNAIKKHAGERKRRQAEAEIEKLAAFARVNPNPIFELTARGTTNPRFFSPLRECNLACICSNRRHGAGQERIRRPEPTFHMSYHNLLMSICLH